MYFTSLLTLANTATADASGFAKILDTIGLGIVWILAAVAVFLLFGLTVFVHELGHYLAARACGLRVDAFSIGFGKAIWQKTVNGTAYKIGWIPFGGYVLLPQLDPTAMQTIQGGSAESEENPGADSATPLPSAAWWKRIIVSLSGPLGNVVLAFLIALLIWALPEPGLPRELRIQGAVIGYVDTDSAAEKSGLRPGDRVLEVNGAPVDDTGSLLTEIHLQAADNKIALSVSNIFDAVTQTLEIPVVKNKLGHFYVDGITGAFYSVINSVEKDSAADRAGLQVGDIILGVNGAPTVSSMQITATVIASEGNPVALAYYRNGELGTLDVTPKWAEFSEDEKDEKGLSRYMIGVRFEPLENLLPWMKHRNPVDQIEGDMRSIGRVLGGLFSPKEAGRVGKALGGPVQILRTMWIQVLTSFAMIIAFIRFLNINLAILNLLPLPVLDGGHIVFALWRGIFGREIHPKIINALVNVFAILLLTAFAVITFRDFLGMTPGANRAKKDKPAAIEQPAEMPPDSGTAPVAETQEVGL